MFGYGENCKLFIKYGDSYIFDDLNNTSDTLMGYPIVTITICGSLVYTNNIGTCIPACIYDYILEHLSAPVITHKLYKNKTPKLTEITEKTEIPVLMVDSCGRFISFYKSIADITKKYPEYNPDAIRNVLNGEYENTNGKVYGKYWSWDYMYYVRMELRQSGHVL